MARQLVPTMRVKVDPNPKGSATTHVTMASANPFERGVTSVREANQPDTRSMLPGMGGFFDDFSAGFTGDNNTPGGTAEGGSATSGGWGGMFGNIANKLVDPLTDVGTELLKQKVIKPVNTGPSQQDMINAAIMGQLVGNKAAPMPSPQPQALPGQTPPQPIIVTAPPQPQPQPVVQRGGMANYMPWIIGGVAVLGIGAMFLMRGKKKG